MSWWLFDGHPYSTAREWEAAFDEFLVAREKWARARGWDEDALPHWQVDGNCPFDWDAI